MTAALVVQFLHSLEDHSEDPNRPAFAPEYFEFQLLSSVNLQRRVQPICEFPEQPII
jgi:hypothetical protein